MNTRLLVDEEHRLIEQARSGDRNAEARLVDLHLLPAYAWVNKFVRNSLVPREDLEQEAALALVMALRKFDPKRGVRFVTYAMWWVRVRVQRACRTWRYLSQEPPTDNIRWIENMPDRPLPRAQDSVDLRALNELSFRRRQAVERVLGLNGHEPHSRDQLAAALGVHVGAANKLYLRGLADLRKKLHSCTTLPQQAA
jgi:RNA polymerase sigma factor (sigma-70 family)